MPTNVLTLHDDGDFKDVELLLAEHEPMSTADVGDSSEVFWESEVAEVLAVSWKEKRSELNKLQKQRKFTAAKELRRSFRIEVWKRIWQRQESYIVFYSPQRLVVQPWSRLSPWTLLPMWRQSPRRLPW